MKHRRPRAAPRKQLGENDMTTRNEAPDQSVCFLPTTNGRMASEAVSKFLVAPSVSNKVAAVVALQAYFAEVELTARCEAGST